MAKIKKRANDKEGEKKRKQMIVSIDSNGIVWLVLILEDKKESQICNIFIMDNKLHR